MTIKEAETITKMYGSFFANINELKYPSEDYEVFVFSSFDLPWSPAKLKYAFFTVAEDMVDNNEIDEHFDVLKIMYGTIDGSFKEEAQKINERMEKILKIKNTVKQEAEALKFEAEFGISSRNPDSGLSGEVEFQNFIADLYGNFAKK
jgi:hypothetical protein